MHYTQKQNPGIVENPIKKQAHTIAVCACVVFLRSPQFKRISCFEESYDWMLCQIMPTTHKMKYKTNKGGILKEPQQL